MSLSAWPAVAQPKPALTADADAPARDVYQVQHRPSFVAACAVTPSCCGIVFTPVPAGNRLVGTHVALQFPQDLDGALNVVWMRSSGSGYQLMLPRPRGILPGVAGVSSHVTWYVNAGTTSRFHDDVRATIGCAS